jgi:hypothetical protein
MNIPGFSAEASLDRKKKHYMTSDGHKVSNVVTPAADRNLCIILRSGEIICYNKKER